MCQYAMRRNPKHSKSTIIHWHMSHYLQRVYFKCSWGGLKWMNFVCPMPFLSMLIMVLRQVRFSFYMNVSVSLNLLISCRFSDTPRNLRIINLSSEELRSGADSEYRDVTCRMSSAYPTNHCHFIDNFFGKSGHRLAF